jgi:hypothetical protein
MGPYLVRPQATSPTRPTNLSPLEEAADEDGSNSSVSSVGARGVALSLGYPSAQSDCDASDDEESDEEEEQVSQEETMDDDTAYNAEEEQSEMDEEEQEEEDDDDDDNDELNNIVEALEGDINEFDIEDLSERFIGVTEDRLDPLTVPKAKRVLSFNTLTALNVEAGHGELESSKRFKEYMASGSAIAFSLGPPAMTMEGFELTSIVPRFRKPRHSPIISSSDDEALDRQLEDELDHCAEESRESTPVPLLTPPGSPLTIEYEINDSKQTGCEWPSNLVVDSALTAVISELRPLSPTSETLADFEREMEHRLASKKTGTETLLTPLLRGISVGR